MSALVGLFWSRREGRLRAPWRLAVFIAVLVALLILAALALVVLRIFSGLDFEPSLPELAVAALAAAGAAAFITGRFIDRRSFATFGLHVDRRWLVDLAFGVAIGAGAVVALTAVLVGAGWVELQGPATLDAALLLAVLLAAVTIVGFAVQEEIIFRGYLWRNLVEGLSFGPIHAGAAVVLTWLITSAIFGVAHALNPEVTPLSMLNIVVAGLAMGLGRVLTGELAIPIGFHVAWNYCLGVVFGFPVSGLFLTDAALFRAEAVGPAEWTGGAFGPEASLLAAPVLVVGGALVWRWVRRRGRHGGQPVR